MRVVLVGPLAVRRRLREQLPEGIEIVSEHATLDASSGEGADAILLGPSGLHVDEPLVEPLTVRELQVLDLLAKGLSNKMIAKDLRISDETVKFHLTAIFRKLAAANRTDAVRLAIRRGLVSL
jgi:DNA-binding NarL/FixJ family response regulator